MSNKWKQKQTKISLFWKYILQYIPGNSNLQGINKIVRVMECSSYRQIGWLHFLQISEKSSSYQRFSFLFYLKVKENILCIIEKMF